MNVYTTVSLKQISKTKNRKRSKKEKKTQKKKEKEAVGNKDSKGTDECRVVLGAIRENKVLHKN